MLNICNDTAQQFLNGIAPKDEILVRNNRYRYQLYGG